MDETPRAYSPIPSQLPSEIQTDIVLAPPPALPARFSMTNLAADSPPPWVAAAVRNPSHRRLASTVRNPTWAAPHRTAQDTCGLPIARIIGFDVAVMEPISSYAKSPEALMNRIFLSFLTMVLPVAALAQTVTRFEQDDPRITYTGVWYPNTNSLESGGSAVLANLKGSQVIVIFNGTGITWIGASDYYSGICYLTLDGVPTSVDTSNPSGATLYQQRLFSVHGLAPGLHRMTIEVIHSHDAITNASWIWVDAFEVENGSLVGGRMVAGAGTVPQTDVAVNYSGHWFQNSGAQYSGGSINLAVDAGARVDFTFNGSAVTWIGYRDEWSGLAQVFIDDALQSTVDTYSTPLQARTPTYSVTGLAPGTHVLSIVATGTHSPASGGSWVWVNGFQVSGSLPLGPPVIAAGGIVSAASFSSQVAPGQVVSIFGQNFMGGGSAQAGRAPLPTQLGPQNTTVTACGRAFPLYSVMPGQINAQIPLECPTGGTAIATITVGGQTATQTFSLAPAAPGIFTVSGSGAGDGVILHADNTLVTTAKPARAGETVVIYATGLGLTNPSFATGAAANQMNTTVLPVTVTIGGKPAPVTYSGLSQGWVGLYQVNATVPSGLTGSQPVTIAEGNYHSQAGVTVAVQ